MTETKAVVDEHLLRDMVTDATVSKLLEAFGKVCDVGAGIFSPSVARIGKGGHHSRFCTFVRSTQEGTDRCVECDKTASEIYRKDPNAEGISCLCHAGLIDFCEPIRVLVKGSARLIGLFSAGQVLEDDEQRPTASDEASLHQLTQDCQLEMRELLACYQKVPRRGSWGRPGSTRNAKAFVPWRACGPIRRCLGNSTVSRCMSQSNRFRRTLTG